MTRPFERATFTGSSGKVQHYVRNIICDHINWLDGLDNHQILDDPRFNEVSIILRGWLDVFDEVLRGQDIYIGRGDVSVRARRNPRPHALILGEIQSQTDQNRRRNLLYACETYLIRYARTKTTYHARQTNDAPNGRLPVHHLLYVAFGPDRPDGYGHPPHSENDDEGENVDEDEDDGSSKVEVEDEKKAVGSGSRRSRHGDRDVSESKNKGDTSEKTIRSRMKSLDLKGESAGDGAEIEASPK